jgi:hypothetical protein
MYSESSLNGLQNQTKHNNVLVIHILNKYKLQKVFELLSVLQHFLI